MPRVARHHVKDCVSNWHASSSSTSGSVTKWVTASRLEAITRPWYFFPNLLRALHWKRPLVVCWTFGRATNLRLQNVGKERGSPQVKSMSNALGKTGRCLVGVVLFRSLRFSCFRRNAPFEAATGTPARQTETCGDEPCVNLALRSRNIMKFWSNIVSTEFAFFASFFLLFFFSLLHFLETGKVNPPPPPPNGHAHILANVEIYERSLSPWAKLKNLGQHFVARSMLNKCAKFRGDSPSGYFS